MKNTKYYLLGLTIISSVALNLALSLPSFAIIDADIECSQITQPVPEATRCWTDSTHTSTRTIPKGQTGVEQGGQQGGDGQQNGVDPSGAAPDCNGGHFMGLRAWYDGLVNSSCEVPTPADETELSKYIWTIVLNLATMLLQIVGYLTVGFVIWGGYQYIMARGEPGKVASGRKTIVNAIIGLVVCMTASIITGAIGDIVSGAAASGKNFFAEIFNKAFFWAGIVAVIFMIYGGIQYVTSSGDTTKVTKAKNTIMNAAIGLVITILAAAIVNLVITSLG